MKKLLIATALVAFVATPALAQQGSWQERVWVPSSQEPALAYAQADARGQSFVVEAPSTAVVANGEIIGQDPDPNVRLEMLRSAGYVDGNGG